MRSGRFNAKTPGAHKKVSMEGGSIAMSTGRDDSSYDVGGVREIGESGASRESGASMKGSLGGMGKGALKRGY